VTLKDAAAGDSTLLATLIVLVIALLVIVPSMALLFRLSLQDRLRP
jgi:cytochrome bd-type quinol oxidase subunit 2